MAVGDNVPMNLMGEKADVLAFENIQVILYVL